MVVLWRPCGFLRFPALFCWCSYWLARFSYCLPCLVMLTCFASLALFCFVSLALLCFVSTGLFCSVLCLLACLLTCLLACSLACLLVYLFASDARDAIMYMYGDNVNAFCDWFQGDKASNPCMFVCFCRLICLLVRVPLVFVVCVGFEVRDTPSKGWSLLLGPPLVPPMNNSGFNFQKG